MWSLGWEGTRFRLLAKKTLANLADGLQTQARSKEALKYCNVPQKPPVGHNRSQALGQRPANPCNILQSIVSLTKYIKIQSPQHIFLMESLNGVLKGVGAGKTSISIHR